MNWLVIAGKYLFTGGMNLFKKFSATGVLVTVLSAAIMIGMWYLERKFAKQEEDRADILEILGKEEARSKELKRVLDNNAEAYATILGEMLKQNRFNKELSETIEGIQNVKHTKETIIREATGECLDSPYPDSVYATFLWGEQTSPTTGDSD